jgi:quinoprotein glucose dehydrogenase
LISGLIIGASGFFLWRRHTLGAWLYGLFCWITLGWALWESGLNGWALMPRLLAPLVLALFFTLPSVRRQLGRKKAIFGMGGLRLSALCFAAAIVPGLVLNGFSAKELDPILQIGKTDARGASAIEVAGTAADWPSYGGNAGGSRYSNLEQINDSTVDKLEVAWVFHIGKPSTGVYNFEVTPIKMDDSLYACTATNDVVALDAETGKQRWRYESNSDARGLTPTAACRGVAYYRVPNASGKCATRIITNTVDARLVAIDAIDGKQCDGFGVHGEVSLLTGMGDVTKGYYYVSSAPTIARGKIVLGGWITDGQYWGEPSGVVRAFDAVTGELSWAFDMGRPDRQGEPAGGEEYTRSTPNSWAPMSVDESLGLVYIPTGNATPDYFGGKRRYFDDKYSSSVVALDAETGRVRWAFQTTHHDLWDYDVSSQPTLADIEGAEGVQHILLQATKRGELFLLDRTNGAPLASVVEHAVPQAGAAPGEQLSSTQPFSDGMPSTRGERLTESMMWGITPIDQLWCRIEFRSSRYEGPATPPGLDKFNIVYPGYAGGSNWGGVSVDLGRGILVTNAMRIANRVRLMSRAETDRLGVFPITGEKGKHGVGGAVAQRGTPYGAMVQPFLSPLNVPCQQPPYGTISAVDLASHKLIWTEPFGTARDSGPLGLSSMLPISMGVPNFGGSITTRGGVTFVGATQDRYIRGFETATGKLLWEHRLPAGGQATPITYLSKTSGRQFVVIAAGGSTSIASKLGDEIIAFALPAK